MWTRQFITVVNQDMFIARNLLSRGRRAPGHQCLPMTEEPFQGKPLDVLVLAGVNFHHSSWNWAVLDLLTQGFVYCSAALAQSQDLLNSSSHPALGRLGLTWAWEGTAGPSDQGDIPDQELGRGQGQDSWPQWPKGHSRQYGQYTKLGGGEGRGDGRNDGILFPNHHSMRWNPTVPAVAVMEIGQSIPCLALLMSGFCFPYQNIFIPTHEFSHCYPSCCLPIPRIYGAVSSWD